MPLYKKYIIPPKLDTFYFNDVFSHRVNYEWEIEEQQRRDYINLNDPDNSPYINLESLIPELEYDYDSSHDYSDLSESFSLRLKPVFTGSINTKSVYLSQLYSLSTILCGGAGASPKSVMRTLLGPSAPI